MKNIPQRIYLQVEGAEDDFNELAEVTWCADRINASDIEYVLAPAGEQRTCTFCKLRGTYTVCMDCRDYDLFEQIGKEDEQKQTG